MVKTFAEIRVGDGPDADAARVGAGGCPGCQGVIVPLVAQLAENADLGACWPAARVGRLVQLGVEQSAALNYAYKALDCDICKIWT